ncbi:hypothetical protein [Streptomyces sp. NPDC058297]|uniref:hypothetical protein n=1 Tax=Streptomyces sp. NPDC058297 TaxID=3346433 RepID=UPI0036E4E6C8
MSGHDWSIDEIIHALPSSELRAKARAEIDLARGWQQLQDVRARWEAVAEQWIAVEAPRIAEARAHYEATGTLPQEHEESPKADEQFDAWRARMNALRQQRGAA